MDLRLISQITEDLYYSSPEELWKKCKVVVILGSATCEYRIERALEIFKDEKIVYLVCGGNYSIYKDASGCPYKEGEFMKNYLLDRGISEEMILCDEESENTAENLRNACAILDKYHKVGPIGVISAGFHMARVKYLAEKLQLPYELVFIPAYGKNTRKDNWFLNETGLRIVSEEYKKGR